MKRIIFDLYKKIATFIVGFIGMYSVTIYIIYKFAQIHHKEFIEWIIKDIMELSLKPLFLIMLIVELIFIVLSRYYFDDETKTVKPIIKATKAKKEKKGKDEQSSHNRKNGKKTN